MALDLTGYFDRVGYRGPAEPTLEVLQGLMTAHTRTIPFENLDPLLGVPVDDLGPDALADKLIRRRRGGYCYEQNGLMGYVLAAMGFRVRRLCARVLYMRPPDAPPGAQTHTALAVNFPGAQATYLVDVGFGGQTPTSPLRMETGSPQQTTLEPYRLDDRGGGWLLQAKVRDKWHPLYEFTTASTPEIDLLVGSWYVSTHPSSQFVTNLMLALVTDDGRVNLSDHTLSIHRADASEKIELEDPAAVVDTLGARFGINVADLGDPSALAARVEKLFVPQTANIGPNWIDAAPH